MVSVRDFLSGLCNNVLFVYNIYLHSDRGVFENHIVEFPKLSGDGAQHLYVVCDINSV